MPRLVTPGWTTAQRLAKSISRMRLNLARPSSTPSASGRAPPESEVPATRDDPGIRLRHAHRAPFPGLVVRTELGLTTLARLWRGALDATIIGATIIGATIIGATIIGAVTSDDQAAASLSPGGP